MSIFAQRQTVEIIDCTLREGTYALDFQMPADTIERVLAQLEACGVKYMELGHGMGLNGHSVSRPSLVPDAEAFKIANDVLSTSGWGAICALGIGRIRDLEEAVDAGASFIRVACNITQVTQAEQHVRRSRELGVFTFMNLMKTQVLDDAGVLAAVKNCESYGAQAVYIVDSFGSLLPDDTTRLVRLATETVDIPVGFHGHDNFGLANANAINAAWAGASFIDTTLDGIGRSAGNAFTEAVSTLLRKLEINGTYDGFGLAATSEKLIQPLDRISDSRYFQLVGAYTNLHSSSFPMFDELAKDEGIDVAQLMERVSPIDSVDPSPELVREQARLLRMTQT
jgi:4-hydroxy-2-oxovalerate aldolase